MSFKEELELLKKCYKSEKLESVKAKLRKSASNGEDSTTIDEYEYDEWVVKWLEAQGLDVEHGGHQRDGYFIRIKF